MKKSENYGSCVECGGHVSAQRVQQVCTRRGRLIAVVDDLPAGVCNQCGTRILKAPVAKRLEELLADVVRNPKKPQVPVTRYAA
jgi:YgiT-type zinc finger domain-containing protein